MKKEKKSYKDVKDEVEKKKETKDPEYDPRNKFVENGDGLIIHKAKK